MSHRRPVRLTRRGEAVLACFSLASIAVVLVMYVVAMFAWFGLL